MINDESKLNAIVLNDYSDTHEDDRPSTNDNNQTEVSSQPSPLPPAAPRRVKRRRFLG